VVHYGQTMVTEASRATAVDVDAAQRRTVGVLLVAQIMGGIAVAGTVAAGALIAASLGGDAAGGLAQTMGVLGAAIFALPLARVALSRGRRASLSLGYGIGAVGALVVIAGGTYRSLPIVLLGCLLVWVASAAGYQARYAAVDLAAPERRGRSLSFVVWAGTIGAVLGPNLLEASGQLAIALGLPQLTGPFLVAAAVLGVAVVTLLLLMHPDPYLLSRQLAADAAPDTPATKPRLRDGIEHLKSHPRAVAGITTVAVGQVVMVMVMVMTPVHMRHVDVSLSVIGLVISVHVLGMYALSPVVGWCVDRFRPVPMALVGAAVLAIACVISAVAPADGVVMLGVGLFLLGLGWSFTLISGSTMLTADVGADERPAVQGLSDLMMNLAGALGGVVAGVVVMAWSYSVLCLVSIVPVVVLAALTLRWLRAPRA